MASITRRRTDLARVLWDLSKMALGDALYGRRAGFVRGSARDSARTAALPSAPLVGEFPAPESVPRGECGDINSGFGEDGVDVAARSGGASALDS